MSVRHGLLAILDQGPCYGYQLRTEFARRTGGIRRLNVGQIYNTLERLERDGLVVRGAADEAGHVYWEITEAGRAEMRGWLLAPTDPSERDALAVKLALAATLPGLDAAAVVRVEQDAVASRLAALREAAYPGEDGPEEIVWSLIADAERFAAEADARWLAHAGQRLAAHPEEALAIELSSDHPKRGRPARAAAAG
ncbi:helix-turn-helix transcriptional regulator [Microbacterium oryzae]|uniref:PadR family transcriptional regulator n=1 Tax=Microbacterium oryzae TaxID=743009 RepID=A0A6I6DN48_9MICO|nr:PadR family transcriptional regulator [Microbacterium oryzae]QGU26345.1 PadR family transcriptional regulator [Microbacterium oryzae]